jgi:hypothetical protein
MMGIWMGNFAMNLYYTGMMFPLASESLKSKYQPPMEDPKQH